MVMRKSVKWRVSFWVFITIAVLGVCAVFAFSISQGGSTTKQRIADKATDLLLAQSTGIDKEAARSLRLLAERFGVLDIEELLLSSLILQLGNDATRQSLEDSLVEIDSALAKSNAGYDLTAPPVPTGDELFDRYARAVDERISNSGYDIVAAYTSAIIPENVLTGWESEFGDDPRYWELRYMCAWYDGKTSGLETEDRAIAEVDHALRSSKVLGILREARSRGAVTANTLLLLYEFEKGQLESDLGISWAEKETLAGEDCSELFELLDEAIELGPDEVWPMYNRAFLHFELGEYDLGLADLDAGNQRPVNRIPMPYPMWMVADSLQEPAPAGSAAVSGAVLYMAFEYLIANIVNMIAIKEYITRTISSVDSADDIAVVDTWHQFTCRFSENWEGDNFYRIAGMSLSGRVDPDAAENTDEILTARQREIIERLRGARMAYIEARRGAANAAPNPMDSALAFGLVGQGYGLCVAFYLYEESEHQLLAESALPILAEMKQVSYSAEELPDCMLKYEPLTREEAIRVRKERNEARRAREAAAEAE